MSGGAKAQIYLWVHADGSLGLRLEMIERRDHGGVHAENAGETGLTLVGVEKLSQKLPLKLR
jgi:hypothetical protein